MKTISLDEFMQRFSEEEQEEIRQQAKEMQLELQLYRLREELEMSQKELAEALNISQPSVAALEKRGNDIKLSSIKRYVEAMGGALRLSVDLPTGKTVSFGI